MSENPIKMAKNSNWGNLIKNCLRWIPHNKEDHKLMIAQISDMHIGPTEAPYRGMPVRQQFLEVIKVLANKPLDLLVLSGDLAAMEGDKDIYLWIKQALMNFPCPYVVMAGNHDQVQEMVEVFNLPSSDVWKEMLCFSRTIKDKRLIFLDSSSKYLSLEQLTWLDQQLMDYEEQVLLFVHHPPILCDCLFMDTYHSLQNIDESWPTLMHLFQISHIFCGHYHTERTVVQDGKSVHLTPSTTFQIDPIPAEFTMEHTRPGWRIIEWKGSKVETYVEYLSL